MVVMMMKGENEIKNLFHVWLTTIASLSYCYFISAKLSKGFPRLISLLPIFSLFVVLPCFLSSAFFSAVAAFFLTWLATFKLLLFAFDHGPLSSNPPKSLPLFIAIASLPIKINQTKDQTERERPKKTLMPLNLATESLIFPILLRFCYDNREKLHPKILLVSYCMMVFLLVDILIALSSFVVKSLVGLQLEPPSNEPYLSSSLQDFWGRRWNLIVTNTLRLTVYEPVRSFSAAILGKKWAPLPAMLTAFLVSGLMHELLFYYVTRAKPTWEMTLFFLLHGVCVVLEFGVKRVVPYKWRLPWVVSGPLTVGFVAATSFWLFFPPLIRNGADSKVLEEFKIFSDLVKIQVSKLPNVLRRLSS